MDEAIEFYRAGIDISLLIENKKLTYEERLENLQSLKFD